MTLARRVALSFALSGIVAAGAVAAGFQLNEHGARAMAQAGAFAARASDGSAVFFNPAGIAFQRGTSFMAGTTLITMSSGYTSPGGVTTNQESQSFFPSNAYVTHTMDNGFAIGLGFFTPFGLGTLWPQDWSGQRLAVKTELQTFFFNPTVAYRFSDKFSLGVGASYVISNVTLSYRVPTYASLLPPTPATVNGSAELTADGNAINFDAGFVYRPIPELSIGGSYRHQTKIDYTGDAKFTNMQALQAFFPGGEGKTTIKLPSTVFFGVAYDVTPHVAVEADYQYTGWSSYDQLAVQIANGPAAPAPLGGQPLQKSPAVAVKDWSNAYMLRLGGEYHTDLFALRAGVIYDKTPQPDAKVEPLLPDANRVEATLGFGYKFTPAFGVDAAYQIILFQDRTVTAPTNIFPGTYKTTSNLFALDLSYGI